MGIDSKPPRLWHMWASFGAFGLAAMWHGVARSLASGVAFLGTGALFAVLDIRSRSTRRR